MFVLFHTEYILCRNFCFSLEIPQTNNAVTSYCL